MNPLKRSKETIDLFYCLYIDGFGAINEGVLKLKCWVKKFQKTNHDVEAD
jgi:hypothetical protein